MNPPERPGRAAVAALLARDRGTLAVVAALALLAIVFVASSLRAPAVETFVPTPPDPTEVGEALVGPRTVTVDATGTGWRYFDFSHGSVVERPGPTGWDVAFERYRMIVNGGAGFAGRGGALTLAAPFDSVRVLPTEGYAGSTARGDSTNAVLADWYDYGWTSHLLTPKPITYAVRTADGRYAKLEMLGYYCAGAQPGCPTFRYVYQGGGGPDVAPAR